VTNNDDQLTRSVLSDLVAFPSDVESDWTNVMQRASRLDSPLHRSSRYRRLLRDRRSTQLRALPRVNRRYARRSIIATFAIITALCGSAFALSANNNWWFFYDGAPAPTSDVIMVTSGTWDGHPWIFTAHRTEDFGICYSLTQGTDATGRPGSLSCSPTSFPTPGTSPVVERMMSSGFSGGGASFPASFFGAADDSVSRIDIIEESGASISIPTIPAPDSLDTGIRFFVTSLPIGTTVAEAIGYDSSGNLIARNVFSEFSSSSSS